MASGEVHYSKFGRSTTLTVGGVVGLIAAGVLAMIGMQMNISSASLYGDGDDGTLFVGLGAVGGFVALLALVAGISQLTTNIDLTAQYIAETMRRAADREVAALDQEVAGPVTGRRAVSSGAREPDAVTGETRRARHSVGESA